jgi:hypothetical protein
MNDCPKCPEARAKARAYLEDTFTGTAVVVCACLKEHEATEGALAKVIALVPSLNADEMYGVVAMIERIAAERKAYE